MIYVDGSEVKVGGVLLPGLYKSLEIQQDAQIDEQTVEGSTSTPKQATGYEDAKISLELILDNGPTQTIEQKLAQIQNLFRAKGQSVPVVHELVNAHTAIRGIDKVLFKTLTSKGTNSGDQMTVSIEFLQYDPTTISATKASASNKKKKTAAVSTAAPVGIDASYQSYLKTNRGKAPTISDKTTASPAKDDSDTAYGMRTLGRMPY